MTRQNTDVYSHYCDGRTCESMVHDSAQSFSDSGPSCGKGSSFQWLFCYYTSWRGSLCVMPPAKPFSYVTQRGSALDLWRDTPRDWEVLAVHAKAGLTLIVLHCPRRARWVHHGLWCASRENRAAAYQCDSTEVKTGCFTVLTQQKWKPGVSLYWLDRTAKTRVFQLMYWLDRTTELELTVPGHSFSVSTDSTRNAKNRMFQCIYPTEPKTGCFNQSVESLVDSDRTINRVFQRRYWLDRTEPKQLLPLCCLMSASDVGSVT